MPGDGRVGGVGQADLLQADARGRAARRRRGARRGRSRRAALARASSRVSSVLIVPPMTLLPRPRTVTGRGLLGVGEERLLGGPAGVPGRSHLAGVELRAAWRRASAATWWASARSMLSPPSRMWSPTARRGQDEVARLLADGDQGEVGRAAADVADEDEVADLDLLAPVVALGVEPGVERGLRLFQQRDVARARRRGRPRRSARGPTASNEAGTVRTMSCSSSRWSACPCPRALVPGLAEVLQVAWWRLDRRDLRRWRRRRRRGCQGRIGRLAVDAGVAQPALGRGDQPARHLGADVAGELADGVVAVRRPTAASERRPAARRGRAGRGTTAAAWRSSTSPGGTTCGTGER